MLLQAIRDKVDVPMIAAGGIVDGRGMAAAFALGAEGVQMGTRFVSSRESPVHMNFKQAILDAEETGTLVLNKQATPCVRALKTGRSREIHAAGVMSMEAFARIQDLYFGGDMEASLGLAGQTAGLIDEVLPVEEIVRRTIEGCFAAFERLGALAAARGF